MSHSLPEEQTTAYEVSTDSLSARLVETELVDTPIFCAKKEIASWYHIQYARCSGELV